MTEIVGISNMIISHVIVFALTRKSVFGGGGGGGVHVACNDKLHWNFIQSALKVGDLYEVLVKFIATWRVNT